MQVFKGLDGLVNCARTPDYLPSKTLAYMSDEMEMNLSPTLRVLLPSSSRKHKIDRLTAGLRDCDQDQQESFCLGGQLARQTIGISLRSKGNASLGLFLFSKLLQSGQS